MDEQKLDQKLEAMTQTIMGGVEELIREVREDVQKTKLEIFDKIDHEIHQSEIRITKQFAPKEQTNEIERRVEKLEEQIA